MVCSTAFREKPFKAHVITGSDPSKPTLVAIRGTVFDVSGNDAYGPKGQYHGPYRAPPLENTQQVLKLMTLEKSSQAKIPPAPSQLRHSSQKTAFRNGAIWRTSTRPCWASGSLSLANGITLWARCRELRTHNPIYLHGCGGITWSRLRKDTSNWIHPMFFILLSEPCACCASSI